MSQTTASRDTSGRQYWQSIQQLAESPELDAKIAQEFPGYDPKEMVNVSRRSFMRLMGASMALAGVTLTGCRRWPKELIVPYASNVKERIPGVPEQYATCWQISGVANGVLASSFDGRPIKIEGHPAHPFSKVSHGKTGATDIFAQASVLELYDPERSRSPINRSGAQPATATLAEFLAAAGASFEEAKAAGGTGVAVLSAFDSSLTTAAAKSAFLKAYPKATWYEYEPINRDNSITGARLAYGQPVRQVFDLSKADVIVSFDSDLLGTHPAHLRNANDWAAGRRRADEPENGNKRKMNRLYIAESTFSLTGTVADARLGVRPSRLAFLLGKVAEGLGVAGVKTKGELLPGETKFVAAVIEDLNAAGTKGVVAVGENMPPEAHAAAHAINSNLGCVGTIVKLVEEPDAGRPLAGADIAKLSQAMASGEVKALIILGGNPAYDAPADVQFVRALAGVPMSVHLSLYDNETSALCKWHVNASHYLEQWCDGRAWDGTVTVGQPLIEPLYNGLSSAQLLRVLAGSALADADGRALQSEMLAGLAGVKGADPKSLENALRKLRHDGMIPGTSFAEFKAAPKVDVTLEAAVIDGLELRLLPDQKLFDGRFANSGWLQEIPDTLSKVTWDNCLLISKADAEKLGVKNNQMVTVTAGSVSLKLPAYIQPGQPRGVVSTTLGYGRTRAGMIGNLVGFDVYPLRSSNSMHAAEVSVSPAGDNYNLASTVDHHILDDVAKYGQDKRLGKFGENGYIIREGTLDQYNENSAFAYRERHIIVPLQLFDPPSQFNDPHAWGMAVDMSACIGCGACMVACQSENNIPVVGKREVERNRDMHWIRIDRYFKTAKDDKDLDNPDVVYQPMMCVHCENAPCEQVCPVAATVHDTEGLNTMVYNRCIGTRYCSNNCPYKVRRFNYFDWHAKDPRALKKHTLGNFHPWLDMPDTQQKAEIDKIKALVFNPEVTVRMRGVMEKCTYCTQRITAAKISRKTKGELIQDGDVRTACQQVCPTEAIVFGNLNDADSAVSKAHRSPRAYAVLDELNTRPRTRYLAKVRNPHPSLRPKSLGHGHYEGDGHDHSKDGHAH